MRRTMRSHTRRMSEIRVNGVSLYYEEHGPGSRSCASTAPGARPPSGATRPSSWRRAAARSSTTGAGSPAASGPSRSSRTCTQHADDAAALIDALAAAPAIVIGRSHGGEIAVDLALRYPDRVRALALLEGGGIRAERGVRRGGRQSSRGAWSRGRDRRGHRRRDDVPRRARGCRLGGLPDPVKQIFVANGPAIVAEFRGGSLDVDAEQLAAIDRPTLLVAGEGLAAGVRGGDRRSWPGDARGAGRVGRGRSPDRPRAPRRARVRRRGSRSRTRWDAVAR